MFFRRTVSELNSKLEPIVINVGTPLPYRTGIFYATYAITIGGVTIPAFSIYDLHVHGGDGVGTAVGVNTAELYSIKGGGGAWISIDAISSKSAITATPVSGVTVTRFGDSKKCGNFANIEFVLDLTANKGAYDSLLTMNVSAESIYYIPLFDGDHVPMNVSAYIEGSTLRTLGNLPSGKRISGSATFMIK